MRGEQEVVMRRGNWGGGGEGGGTRTAIIMFVSGKGQADYRPAAEYGSTKYGGNNRRSMRMEGGTWSDIISDSHDGYHRGVFVHV